MYNSVTFHYFEFLVSQVSHRCYKSRQMRLNATMNSNPNNIFFTIVKTK